MMSGATAAKPSHVKVIAGEPSSFRALLVAPVTVI
jgi:hypothetical protein